MTERLRLADGSTPDVPVVVAEDLAVLVIWDGMSFRCSADAAHVLSDNLFEAALAVEGRLTALEGGGDN